MSALNIFLFIVLPYLALAILLIGSIYRYRTNGFTVSSLSSEFLEGRALFWGSQPFHWGLMFLFFGHLIAFLIPQSVLTWNSEPVRLIILEVSAFAFGLAVLFGLCALIYRRFSNPRIRTVTSKMDVFLLALLLLQTITGLLIAYSSRWGSSWFAAVLTPYLWSIFTLTPDISAVSQANWVIQTHIAGAFVLFLIIPFTRLIHLLVYPLPYIWRPYQVVRWYWDRKKIRDPQRATENNVPPKNN